MRSRYSDTGNDITLQHNVAQEVTFVARLFSVCLLESLVEVY